jgi:signal transduction protein with GAF and PtsI domain
MIKALEKAIEKVQILSSERQEYVAALLEEIAAEGDVYKLTDSERQLVREGTAELDRGEYASDAAVRAVLRRPWA